LKTKLFIHGDSDGVVCGALAYRYYVSKGAEVDIIFTHPAGLVEDLIEFAKPGDRIFIADIALSEKHLKEIMDLFNKYSRSGELIYIDHHPEPIELDLRELEGLIIHDTCCSASELAYKFFQDVLGFEYSRVALYGAIGDYLDETPWAREILHEWDKRSIYFEAGVLAQGLEASRKLYDFKRHVVKHLSENKLPSSLSELLIRALIESVSEDEMRIWVKKNVVKLNMLGYVIEPPGSLGRAAHYARIYSNKPVGLAASRHRNNMVISIRSIREIDLNRVLRIITPKLNGTGGGHPFAAGARVHISKFKDFLAMLDNELMILYGRNNIR